MKLRWKVKGVVTLYMTANESVKMRSERVRLNQHPNQPPVVGIM
jgi:hypothetical protein